MQISYNFENITDYLYDDSLVQVLINNLQLLLQEDNIDFTEDCQSDTGFTYDSDYINFSPGLFSQKDQRDFVDNFYVPFSTNMDATRYGGSPIGTAYNGAIITSGELDLSAANSYASWPALDNCNFAQQGTKEFYFRPNYDSSPLAQSYIFTEFHIGDNKNLINLYHLAGGALQLQCYNSLGQLQINVGLGVWNPIAGQKYRISFNYDFTNGATRLFIDGVQQGSTQTNIFTRDSNEIDNIILGANRFGTFGIDGLYDDLQCFDSVLHTSNYIPSIPAEYAFSESSLVFPEMEHVGEGSIKLFNYLLMTYTGDLGILLEIDRSGDKLWWNGSSWVVSDGTYVQSTDLTTFNLHSTSLHVDGAKYGQFTVIFPDSNTQGSISELTANMKVNIGYSTTNPKCSNSEVIRTDSIESIEMNTSISGSDAVSMAMEVDGVEKYWNGTAWASSSGYSQSNTLSEINTNLSTLLDAPANVRWILYLHSEDGSTTPIVPGLTVNFSFAGSEKDEIETCAVWWYMAENRTVNIFLKNDCVKYKTNVMLRREDYNYEITAGENEYCEVNLPDTVNMEVDELDNEQTYVVLLDGKRYEINIPNQDGALLFDLIGA
jgi:hypothetical protein